MGLCLRVLRRLVFCKLFFDVDREFRFAAYLLTGCFDSLLTVLQFLRV